MQQVFIFYTTVYVRTRMCVCVSVWRNFSNPG